MGRVFTGVGSFGTTGNITTPANCSIFLRQNCFFQGAADQYFFYTASSATSAAFGLLNKGTTHLLTLFTQAAGSFSSSFTISTSAWSTIGIAGTVGGTMTFYANGASAGTANTAGVTTATDTWRLGNDTSGSLPVNATEDDFAVWNVTLTAAEFAALDAGARPNTIRPANLILWYPFDGLQSPEPDLSGKANNLVLTSPSTGPGAPKMMFTPRWPNALFAPTLQPFGSGVSGARKFSTGQAVRGPYIPTVPAPASTWTMWINLLGGSISDTFLLNGDFNNGVAGDHFRFVLEGAGVNVWHIEVSNAYDADMGFGAMSNNTWYHLALVYIGGSQFFPYQNGVVGSVSNHAPPTVSANTLTIGALSNVGVISNSFGGAMADVAYWSTNLTAGEVAALAKGARPWQIRPSSLVRYYPLDGLQPTEPDYSGGNQSATVIGATPNFGPPLMQFSPRWPQSLFVPPAFVLWAQSAM